MRSLEDKAALAVHDLGVVYYTAQQYRAAIQSYERALRSYRKLGNRELEALVLDHLGSAYYALGDYAGAKERYQASLEGRILAD